MNQKIGFPKIDVRGEGEFKPPEPKNLNHSCEPGDFVRYKVGNESFDGVLQEWRSVALIKLMDGTERLVEIRQVPKSDSNA